MVYFLDLNEDILSSIELIPVSVREDLKSVASWLDKNGTSDRLTVYAKQRAYVLSESLKVNYSLFSCFCYSDSLLNYKEVQGLSIGFLILRDLWLNVNYCSYSNDI